MRSTRGDPVAERAGPDDRGAIDEQDVAGEHGLGVGNIGEQVTVGVSRSDLEQFDGTTPDGQGQLAGESTSRRSHYYASEVEGPERRLQKIRNDRIAIVGRDHFAYCCGRDVRKTPRRRTRWR